MKALDSKKIAELLRAQPTTERKTRTPKDVTEPREYATWWKLRHSIREEGCENPNCVDTRSKGDKGVNVVASIKGRFMCRYCYIAGWLSDRQTS